MKELLMCPPRYLSTTTINNIWMLDLPQKEREINLDAALEQFMALYMIITNHALVYLLPPTPGLQDQTYATNPACVLPHLDKTAVISHFRADGRVGEEWVALGFLETLGYTCYTPPAYFEGEGELKWIRDNQYIASYGLFTSYETLCWIEKAFDAEIIKLKALDNYLYHVDCFIFPVDSDTILACKEVITDDDWELLNKEFNVINVALEDCYEGITNSLRIEDTIYNGMVHDETPETTHKNNTLTEIAAKLGLDSCFVDIDEFTKSGALLSCMFMHLKH
jgi:N-dimethylarginine dimethylaminohydrolase